MKTLEPTRFFGWAIFILLFATVAGFYFLHTNGTWIITPDSTQYVEGARSIAQANGYVNFMGNPITLFPPGTSVVYAFAAALPANDYLYFNVTTRILLLGYLLFSFLFLKRAAGWTAGLLGFLILSFSVIPLTESTRILSDIPFAFVLLITFFLFGPEQLSNLSTSRAVLLGFLIFLTYITRTVGLFVFAGYFFYTWIAVKTNRARILIAISLVMGIGILCLWVRQEHNPSAISYGVFLKKQPWVVDSDAATFTDWKARIGHNIFRQIEAMGIGFTNGYRPFWIGLALLVVALAGMLDRDRNGYSLFCFCFLLFYFLLHSTPREFQDRYLISILPILFLLLWKSLVRFSELFREGIWRVVPYAALVVIMILSGYWNSGYHRLLSLNNKAAAMKDPPVLYRDHEKLQQLILKNYFRLKPGETVAAFHTNVVRYLTPAHTKFAYFLLSVDEDKVYRNLREQNPRYLLIDLKQSSPFDIQDVLKKFQGEYALVASNPGAALYEKQADHNSQGPRL